MRSITVRRVLSSILLPLYLSSCTYWQVPPVSPEQAITEDQPSKIRVTLTDSSTVEMEQPRIVGDTLRGLVKGAPPSNAQQGAKYVRSERDVLLADIATVRIKKTNVARTVGTALFAVAVVAILVSDALAFIDSTGGT